MDGDLRAALVSLATLAAGTTLAPGAATGVSYGKFTLGTATTGVTTVNGTYAVNINGTAAPTAGTTSDQISVLGALTLNSTTSVLTVSTAGSSALVVGQVFAIALNDGADAVTNTFSNLAQGATVTDGVGDTYTISYTADLDGGSVGNDVSLTLASISAVPEPATWLSGFVLVGSLGFARRRQLAGWFGHRAWDATQKGPSFADQVDAMD